MTTTAELAVQLLQLPVADIEEHPANPRRDVGNVDELAASIAEVGVLEPVLVCPAGVAFGMCGVCQYVHELDAAGDLVRHTKNQGRAKIDCPGTGATPTIRRDRWRLLAGHRRLKAARQAGLATVPALARPDIAGDAEQLAAMLTENLQRRDLSPVEEADGYAQLRLFGWKVDQVATATGRSKAMVSSRLKLAKLPDATRERLHTHELTLDVAEKLVEFADDPATLAKLERSAAGYNFAYDLQWARRHRQEAKAKAKTEKELAGAGVEVIDRPDQFPWRSVEQPVLDVVGPPDLTGMDAAARQAATEKAIAEHATCEHHAAIVNPGGVVQYVCTNPPAHPDWEAGRQLHDPGAETEAAAEREQEEQLAVASEVRLEFLGDTLTRPLADGALLPVVRRAVRRRVTSDYQTDDRIGRVLELLGLPLPSAKKNRKAALLAWIDAAPSVASLARVFLAFDVVVYETDGYGTSLRSPYGWDRGDGQGADWLAHLEQLGYEPSDFERGLLARADEEDRSDDDRDATDDEEA